MGLASPKFHLPQQSGHLKGDRATLVLNVASIGKATYHVNARVFGKSAGLIRSCQHAHPEIPLAIATKESPPG